MNRHSRIDCDGMSRRGMLQAGLAGTIGLGLPELLRRRAAAAETSGLSRDTAIIYIEMAGGPTQHETYDPKPDAPAEYRGAFDPIDTALPGVQFSEFMPNQAQIADKLAVLRAVYHDSGSHGTSSHMTQTGYYLRDRQNRDNEMPCIGSITARMRGANAHGIPPFVSLPSTMRYGRAAWLGAGYNAFSPGRSADDKRFSVPNLTLLKGISTDRLGDRRSLLKRFDEGRRLVDNARLTDAIDQFTSEAFDMVTGDHARRAFEIASEPQHVRDKYGMNAMGQNMLLARRLVEAGVTVVTVRANTSGSWDDHTQLGKRMKAKGYNFDQGVAALVGDLHERGLAERTMVVCMGEFGRTPRVNNNAGRDHWGRVMSVVLAGGGLPVGQVIGSSDSNGAEPRDRPYRPEHVLAMLYRHLGIDTGMTFNDTSGRPRYVLERRELISELV